MLLIGGALLCAVVALFSSYRGSIALEQDAPGAILALAAASALEQLSTVVVMIVGTAVVTALFFLLLGAAKLGGLARFLPYPVMDGFLAGTGWLLVIGGIGVMVTTPLGPGLFQQSTLARWLPGKAPIRLGTMLAGREVGSIGFYLGVKRTASVVADTPSVVYCFSKQILEHVERIAPATAIAFHRKIVHVLGERVVHLTKVVDALQR